jgi:hypothetical protein
MIACLNIEGHILWPWQNYYQVAITADDDDGRISSRYYRASA